MRPRRVEGQKVYLLLYEMFLEGSSHALGYGGQNELVHWDEITEPGSRSGLHRVGNATAGGVTWALRDLDLLLPPNYEIFVEIQARLLSGCLCQGPIEAVNVCTFLQAQ